LLVMGRRGHGTFRDMLLGSVSRQVTVHAKCPLVLVPPPVEEAK
jgi:nucleotide-binding universal stress UspA family protein